MGGYVGAGTVHRHARTSLIRLATFKSSQAATAHLSNEFSEREKVIPMLLEFDKYF
jgi:hypothetical protein